MQVTETNSDGLKRELQVVVGVDELNERFSARLSQMKDRVNLKGFRRGKVPIAHLKKVYGKAVMAEVLEDAVKETSIKALQDREERPAFQPSIALTEDQQEIERIINGEADLSFTMSFEVIPRIEIADLTKLQLVRPVAEVTDADIEDALGQLRERNVGYETEEGRAASAGDQINIDFVGKIDGEAFEGGSAEGIELVLGQGQFIPGFEEGLTGAKAGDTPHLNISFPDDYPAEHLAGKQAVFETKVNAVAQPKVPEANDEFAKTLGVDDLAKLKELLRERITQEFAEASRLKLKRALLDELEKAHEFELPPSMVDREFDMIWGQLTRNLEQEGKTFEDEGKPEEEVRKEYRAIAERRVRLGLVIGDIGEKNKIEVTSDELRRALMEHARRYPGQEKLVYEYYEKTPGALNELRAPLFEDKVVNYILELAKPTETVVSKEELLKSEEDEAAQA